MINTQRFNANQRIYQSCPPKLPPLTTIMSMRCPQLLEQYRAGRITSHIHVLNVTVQGQIMPWPVQVESMHEGPMAQVERVLREKLPLATLAPPFNAHAEEEEKQTAPGAKGLNLMMSHQSALAKVQAQKPS